MAIGVNARTSFSLFFPPIVDEFGWERGVTAGAFSSAFWCPRRQSLDRPHDGSLWSACVMELGVALMAGGLLLAPLTTRPWHLYLTIGVMVGSGSVCLGYSGQSLFLPNWFNRRRGLAMGLAFAGVGIGSITLCSMGAAHDRADRLANRLHRDRYCGSGGAGADQHVAAQAAGGHRASAGWRRCTFGVREAGILYRRSRLGRHRLDLGPRSSHGTVLVARARLFLRIVYLVRGAGSPDQIPSGHRLWSERRGLGSGRGQPARYSRPDRARTPLRSAGGANGSGPRAAWVLSSALRH